MIRIIVMIYKKLIENMAHNRSSSSSAQRTKPMHTSNILKKNDDNSSDESLAVKIYTVEITEFYED